jgi:hypothetical protein
VSHTWQQTGSYILRVKALDEYAGESNWTTLSITVADSLPPTITITCPTTGLYLFDTKLIPLSSTVIIGAITIQAEADDQESGIDKVEFYIDDELSIADDIAPYEWLWDETAFFVHRVSVVAYDNGGNHASDHVDLWIFNP